MGIEQNVTPTSSHLLEKRGKTMPSVGIYRPPGARRISSEGSMPAEVTPVVKPKTKQKQRRPDLQVYVPRAKRSSTGARSEIILPNATAVTTISRPMEIIESTITTTRAIHQPSEHNQLESKPGNVSFVTTPTKTPTKYNKEDSNTAVYLDQAATDSSRCVDLNACSSETDVNRMSLIEVVQELDITSSITTKIDLPVVEKSSTNCVPVSSMTTEIYCRDESCSDTDTISDSVINSLQADCEKYVKCSNDFINISIRTDAPTYKQSTEVANGDHIGFRPVNSEVESVLLECPIPINSSCLVEILPTIEREQKCEDEQTDIGRIREEQNRKNRSIQRGNIKYLSDVLVISDVEDSPVAPSTLSEDIITVPTEITRLVRKASVLEEVNFKSEDKDVVSHSTSRLNPDECTWDMMFDDSGDCLDPFLLEELTSKVGSVSIKSPRSDYKNFTTVRELQPADSLAHIIEIYNFPAEFKTQDLMSIFSAYQSRGFEIKWVDDTHALGVFGSSVVADEVIETTLPFVKTRRLTEGTPESKAKARRSSEFLQPYRARPETCPALARRLVTSALGVKLSTARQEREAEKALLKVARDKKKLVARLKDAAWEGTLEGTMSTNE